ncbi:rRNA maturation RNase YbeY [Neolewinella litorea]|uniref:rRNA maturation RNase YbeY n=1 Tax=Neolewinella litorea TaxID=2562452 RepID=A0A4S4NHF5_9BACT|nr:rRNA maturation RNase YbeY [Neolewinella litorea]THH35530.1 rRNA maturation RNase YbeY [Neolewinella litorea]
MNLEYLQHDTLTDIITFPYSDFPEVSGDLFISTDRIADNAREFGEPYVDELHRVMVHGILHLCGQGDKSESETAAMRELEQWALSLRPPTLLG